MRDYKQDMRDALQQSGLKKQLEKLVQDNFLTREFNGENQTEMQKLVQKWIAWQEKRSRI